MSKDELVAIVNQATPDERVFLEHYLAHLRRSSDPAHAADLGRRMRDMDQGKKVRWPEVRKRLGLKATDRE